MRPLLRSVAPLARRVAMRRGAARHRARTPTSSDARRARRAGTAAPPSRAGRRGGSGSRRRARATPRPRSRVPRRCAGTSVVGPSRTSRCAAPRATVTRFDFGASDEVDGRLGEGELRLGEPDQLERARRGGRDEQRARVRHPDVLARQDDEAPRDEPGRLPRLEHPRQPVERGVGVRPAHGLDERAHLVVVLVAPLVQHPAVACAHDVAGADASTALGSLGSRPRERRGDLEGAEERRARRRRRRRPAARPRRRRPRRSSARAPRASSSLSASASSGRSRKSVMRLSSGAFTSK